jgi:hypothetical protein
VGCALLQRGRLLSDVQVLRSISRIDAVGACVWCGLRAALATRSRREPWQVCQLDSVRLFMVSAALPRRASTVGIADAVFRSVPLLCRFPR